LARARHIGRIKLMTLYNCTIREIKKLNDQIYRIRLVPEDLALLNFKAGQYIILHLSDDKKIPLSIASSPKEKNFLELHVRLTHKNSLADEMINHFKQSEHVILEGAYGECHLNESDREIIFIAGGTGFSPMKSMLETLFIQNKSRKTHLFLGAQVKNDLYLQEEIELWTTDNKHFSYTPVISDGDALWTGAVGFPHEHAIEHCGQQLLEKDFYISGSGAMVMAVYSALQKKDVSSSNIYSDILNIKRAKGEID